MSVRIERMTSEIEAQPEPATLGGAPGGASGGAFQPTWEEIEKARAAARHAASLAARTGSEGFDD